MSDNPPTLANSADATPTLQRQRDDARRSLLRANTAVALVLLVVVALAVTAVYLGWRATRARDEAEAQQRRATNAEAKARADLWRAYLSEARATRLGNLLERRVGALESVERAAAIMPSPELRTEAVAALALPEFQRENSIALDASVLKFAFDAPLRRCALGLTNGDVVIRSLADGTELVRLRREDGGIPATQDGAAGLEFSEDGRRLAVRYLGGGLAVWDINERRVMLSRDTDARRRLASDGQFSSDGRHVVTPVFAPRDGIAVLEVETGREVAFYPEFSSFRHASVRPGTTMLAVNDDKSVVVIDWTTNERVVFPFPAGVRRTAWSPDGKFLAISGHHLEAHVWSLAERERRVLSGHKGDIWELAWDPASKQLATSSEDGTSRIWDVASMRVLGVTSSGYVFRWGENERLGCAQPRKALGVQRLAPSVVYQAYAGAPAEVHSRTLDVSADGAWAASVVEGRGFYLWNLNDPAASQWREFEGVRSFCFHPSEARLLLTTGTQAQSLPYSTETNDGVSLRLGTASAFHPSRRTRFDLVTMAADGSAIAWVELAGGNVWVEQDGGRLVRMRNIGHSSVAGQSSSARGAGTISLSPDGRLLACGYSRGRVRIFEAGTGEEITVLSRLDANVQFSPSGEFLVAADRDSCKLFRVADWKQVWQVACAASASLPAPAAFSPDSAMVAVAKSAHSAALIDARIGRELAELEGPSAAPISALRWSVDGKRLIASTREGQIEVWRPGVLRDELAKRGLGWDADAPLAAAVPVVSSGARPSIAPWIAAGAMATVSLVSAVAVLSLRRHRKLVVDFTRTEALAARRERELQDEREVNQLKNSFVSMVSHEFRTPLGIIQSSAQILDRYLDRLPPERRREQVASITRNVRRMTGLIDEVLLLGKFEAGRMSFTPGEIDLASFCRRLTNEMLSATDQRCVIRLKCDSQDFPPAAADENLLRHILGNLISNATKYSEPGSEVEFVVERRGPDALFSISDQGIGIPAGERETLFDAFQRASNAAQFQGTGLGLTIVKRCVELHGGEITFTSEEGKGTTFNVRIPMFPVHTAEPGKNL